MFGEVETLTLFETLHTYGLWKILSLIWIPTIATCTLGNYAVNKLK